MLLLLATASTALCEKNATDERVKRNNNEFHAQSVQNRRSNDANTFTPSITKLQPPSPTSQVRPRHTRPKPIHVPPYAVKMEPLVQYSQRDPLYHDKEIQYNITSISEKHSKDDTFAEGTNNFVDYSPHYAQPSFDHGYPSHHYYKEPEPIIEIIIKESNESLPAPPVTNGPTPKPTKEPIQVFYVKYKKNPSSTHYGKEEVIYEEPVPALTPVSTDIVESHPTEPTYPTAPYTNPPQPSTTLRTIIRPDSEIYHGSGLKVTFGNHEESYPAPYERSIEAQKRDSVDQAEAQDYKPQLIAEPESPSKHSLEQRQSQNEFARFVNPKHEPSPPTHAAHRPNSQNAGLPVQPLQYDDGSYERPPPPTYHTNANHPQQRIVFPSQIPFRPQHTLNFQPQSGEFSPEFLQPQFQHPASNIQNAKQLSPPSQDIHQPPFQHIPNVKSQSPQSGEFSPELRQSQFQHSINLPQPKLYPRVTQAIIPQPQFSQGPLNGQFPQETSFTGNKHVLLAPNDVTRLQLLRQNELHANKHTRIVPSPPDNTGNVFTPQVQHHQQVPFKNDFAQFQNQKVQFQQPLSHQQHQHVQQPQYVQSQQHQQPQHVQSQPPQHIQPQQPQHPQQHQSQPPYFQEKPLADRQKQFFEKQRTQNNQKLVQQRRPFETEKFQSQEYPTQYQTERNELKYQTERNEVKYQTERNEIKPQPSNVQPNYKEVVSANRQRQPQKSTQPQKIKNDPSLIQDGQIYQSISHSEDHQILNQLDSYNHNTASKQNHNQNVQYVSSPQEIYNFNQPPKQTFEQRPVYSTTSKPATKKEKVTVSYSTPASISVQTNKKEKNDSKSLPAQLAALPAEVPDDLREQLLSSGILSNADIQILDYDKVGDIPIESLPPEALENLYGAGSAPVPSFAFPNTTKSVEMKVVRYNSTDQNVQSSYVQDDSTEVDPVVLNDSSYNRYLPLKVKGSQFPIPDSPLLKNKKITSVVVLAPVDYDYVQQEEERKGKNVPQVHGVRFISGESLKRLVKNPTEDNFLNWIEKERETPPNKQSVILLVTK